MVAQNKKVKIYRGETPVEELQRAFKEELTDILKDAALKFMCEVEMLKCRVANDGTIEVVKMTFAEKNESDKVLAKQKRVAFIRKVKGMPDDKCYGY